ncbi:germination protein YpeB [Heyndrickxia acidiproducens]|uniref:germination protein YpeB n=1 Tax=Heyndrickxia acidiproducens TaxID=1121084 RepID=UPI00037318A9|nr:germination protein YpeB [Heyndrickxia acidiproducens]
MLRGILIAVLALGIAGTAIWGYQEHREKKAVLIHAENTYQRAFHDLTYKMDLLHDEIGNTLAMNSRKSLSPALAEVWRLTSEANADVGQLPLTLLPFNKTEEFLSNIGNFSYRTAVRDLDKEPLSDKEYASLKRLYSQSSDIQDELRDVQKKVLKNNLRWMDVEMALASGKEASDNTIIDGFKTVEKTVKGYENANLNEPSFTSFQNRDENYDHLEGKTISKQDAIRIAKEYAGIKHAKSQKVSKNGNGANFSFYSVNLVDNNGNEVTADITKRGGYPIWLFQKRSIGKQSISLNEAAQKASAFLNKHHFEKMEIFESSQYDNIGVFSFVATQGNVRIYPETVNMKVALDNGQIVGFAANDFLSSHQKRSIPKAKLAEKEARSRVNPKLQVMESRLAIIRSDLNKEVLCYEFLGTMNEDTYRIYINAQNGNEEKVEKLKDTERIYGKSI